MSDIDALVETVREAIDTEYLDPTGRPRCGTCGAEEAHERDCHALVVRAALDELDALARETVEARKHAAEVVRFCDSQTAKLDAAEAERDRYREALRILESSEDHRLKAAEAELERLKDALRRIAEHEHLDRTSHPRAVYELPYETARAALADEADA